MKNNVEYCECEWCGRLVPCREIDGKMLCDRCFKEYKNETKSQQHEAKMNEWTSVKDRLPDEKQSDITHDFEYVLCVTTFGDVRAYQFGTPIGWNEPHFWHGAGNMDEYVTHWMPFPDMPVLS